MLSHVANKYYCCRIHPLAATIRRQPTLHRRLTMARLAAFFKDLTTTPGRIAASDALMAHVYGPFDPEKHTASSWQPRPYEENKSRYLWTDAFGVINYISLACETGKSHYLDQADTLINAVHNTLGHQRSTGGSGGTHPPRLGNATDDRPTLGGLRIGKKDPEGYSDGDGQYFHYLTKWAFALNRMSLATGDNKYNNWAVDLLTAIHPHFVHRMGGPGGALHIYWKMSIDLERPAVPSEGNLDPFDGLVTVKLVCSACCDPGSTLVKEESDFQAMVDAKYRRYSSTDPLDLGEALWLSHWALDQQPWAKEVAERSAAGLGELWDEGYFKAPPGFRLAFREFGTTLGVQVNEFAGEEWEKERVEVLHKFWAPRVLDRDSDITPVMMAASLVPGAWDRRFEEKLKDAPKRREA